MESIYLAAIKKKILLSRFFLILASLLIVVVGISSAPISQAADRLSSSVSFDLLNKLSAKKHRIKVPLGAAYVIQDIRIVPRSCTEFKDELYNKKDTHLADVEVFLEQDSSDHKEDQDAQEPILLYKGNLSNNTRAPSSPIEHPIYDLILVSCG